MGFHENGGEKVWTGGAAVNSNVRGFVVCVTFIAAVILMPTLRSGHRNHTAARDRAFHSTKFVAYCEPVGGRGEGAENAKHITPRAPRIFPTHSVQKRVEITNAW